MPWSRRLANDLGTLDLLVGRGHGASPTTSRATDSSPARSCRRLLESREDGFEFEVEMITLAIRAGLAIDWVPIPTIYEDQGSHIRPIAHVSNFLRVAWAARRSVGQPLDPEWALDRRCAPPAGRPPVRPRRTRSGGWTSLTRP